VKMPLSSLELQKRTVAGLLGQVEAELRRSDRVEDSIGAKAREWEEKCDGELARRAKKLNKPAGMNDADQEGEYLWLTRQRHHARLARATADQERRRR